LRAHRRFHFIELLVRSVSLLFLLIPPVKTKSWPVFPLLAEKGAFAATAAFVSQPYLLVAIFLSGIWLRTFQKIFSPDVTRSRRAAGIS
jgi:hypothetical protein